MIPQLIIKIHTHLQISSILGTLQLTIEPISPSQFEAS